MSKKLNLNYGMVEEVLNHEEEEGALQGRLCKEEDKIQERLMKILKKTVSPEAYAMVEEILEVANDATSKCQDAYFKQGFRDGLGLNKELIEALSAQEE